MLHRASYINKYATEYLVAATTSHEIHKQHVNTKHVTTTLQHKNVTCLTCETLNNYDAYGIGASIAVSWDSSE